MIEKKIDMYIVIGITANILLIGLFVFLYFGAQPSEELSSTYEDTSISSLSIYNDKLNSEMNTLKKSDSLPINIDPSELGKQNPYTP